MAIIRWSPERELLPLGFPTFPGSLNRWMNRFLTGNFPDEDLLGTFPPVDIIEKNDEYIVKAEVPGMNRDDLKITVVNNVLTIRGERNQEEEEKGQQYYRMERSTGSFQRSFTLPFAVDPDDVKADYDNGILTIHLPKTEEQSPKEINIGSGTQAGFQPQIERGQTGQQMHAAGRTEQTRGRTGGTGTRGRTTGKRR